MLWPALWLQYPRWPLQCVCSQGTLLYFAATAAPVLYRSRTAETGTAAEVMEGGMQVGGLMDG
jgi:hypothetical protein